MRAIILMFDSLNRHMLPPYKDTFVDAPNFARLASKTVTFDNFYAGSLPCMPARREMHTGRHNFLHRSWGPLEPFDDSMPQMLRDAGVHSHLVSDHPHYWEDGGATYHTRYSTWEFFRGQEGDRWKGVVNDTGGVVDHAASLRSQDAVNRRYMSTEDEHSQTRTIDAGLEFLDTNVHTDRWMLQIELFDPHEPYFSPQGYRDRYPHDYGGPEFDWPGYQKVTEPDSQIEHARYEYAALVSMCDHSLGRVLDFMDEHNMWDDTMLIVNTDHGFLLGEHGWWAKSVQPWFNELVHLPMFFWDPRARGRDQRQAALAQTIDIAPTVLRFFEIDPSPDMQGRDLSTLDALSVPRVGVLFGLHGGHVNVTDGRYVYMRASTTIENKPLQEFTLMPTHMASRFSVEELQGWEQAPPFSFTKGLSLISTVTSNAFSINPWQHGTLLWDLVDDPGQDQPFVDDEVELRMLGILVDLMRESDAPLSQFERLGLPSTGSVQLDHLRARLDRKRATLFLQELPRDVDIEHREIADRSLHELLATPRVRQTILQRIPWLVHTELVMAGAQLSLLGLARRGAITRQEFEETLIELSLLFGEPTIDAGMLSVSNLDIEDAHFCPISVSKAIDE